MSRFYASIQGNRGEATRQGTPSSGIEGHIRGWSTGAAVRCYVDPETGEDVVAVDLTHGSSGYSSSAKFRAARVVTIVGGEVTYLAALEDIIRGGE